MYRFEVIYDHPTRSLATVINRFLMDQLNCAMFNETQMITCTLAASILIFLEVISNQLYGRGERNLPQYEPNVKQLKLVKLIVWHSLNGWDNARWLETGCVNDMMSGTFSYTYDQPNAINHRQVKSTEPAIVYNHIWTSEPAIHITRLKTQNASLCIVHIHTYMPASMNIST